MDSHLVHRGTVESYLAGAYAAGHQPGIDGVPISLNPTSITMKQGRALTDVIIAERAVRTLETGMAAGMSTLFICAGLLEVGGLAHHTVFDPYQHSRWHGAGVRGITELQLGGHVDVRIVESQIGLAHLAVAGSKYDLAFIDGDHRFDGVFVDLALINRLVRPGGMVVVDDVTFPSVNRAVQFFLRNCAWVEEAVVQDGSHMLVLRRPETDPTRAWDHYVDF